jgi:hypothetical protein
MIARAPSTLTLGQFSDVENAAVEGVTMEPGIAIPILPARDLVETEPSTND